MIALCTDAPSAKLDGERVIATVPSGAGMVEIAFTPHQAIHLFRDLRSAALGCIDKARSATVVGFKRGEA